MAGKVTAGLAAQSIGLGSRRRCAFVYVMSFTGCLLRNCRSAHCHDAEMTRHVISVYSSLFASCKNATSLYSSTIC